MKTADERRAINFKIVLLCYVFNPGAILLGLAFYGILLDKKPFHFISNHAYTNKIFVMVGLVLLLVNLVIVFMLENRKNQLK